MVASSTAIQVATDLLEFVNSARTESQAETVFDPIPQLISDAGRVALIADINDDAINDFIVYNEETELASFYASNEGDFANRSDLSIRASAPELTLLVGAELKPILVSISNNGPQDASDVVLSFVYPMSIDIVFADETCERQDTNIVCLLMPIKSGDQTSLAFSVGANGPTEHKGEGPSSGGVSIGLVLYLITSFKINFYFLRPITRVTEKRYKITKICICEFVLALLKQVE